MLVCCAIESEIQLLVGTLLPYSSPIRLHTTSYSARHGARWNRKVAWVPLAPPRTFPLAPWHVLYEEDWRLVSTLTGFFLWCSIYTKVF